MKVVFPPFIAVLVKPTLTAVPIAVKPAKILQLTPGDIFRRVKLVPILGDAPILSLQFLIPTCTHPR
jgi:hypothetical protein